MTRALAPAFLATPSLPLRGAARRVVCRRAVFSLPSPARRAPSAAASASSAAALRLYERFLRSEASSSPAPPAQPHAPVFATAAGALVCEWAPPPARPERHANDKAVHAMLCIADYEAFLATEHARGVDTAVPVYCTSDGALVCHYEAER